MAEHFLSALELFFKIALNFIHRNEFKLLRQRSYIQYTVQYCSYEPGQLITGLPAGPSGTIPPITIITSYSFPS